MLKKISTAVLIGCLLSGGAAQAYDLPRLKPDKEISEPTKALMLKSDWRGAEQFEQQIKARLTSGEELAPDDLARLPADKNYVFVAFYNDAPYFLDRYSLKVKKNSGAAQVWEQKIFPITQKFSPRNATSTQQRFSLRDGQAFNSAKAKEALSAVTDEADKKFLEECFKVGYFYAFGHEAPRI